MVAYSSILTYMVVLSQQSLLLPDSYGQLWGRIKEKKEKNPKQANKKALKKPEPTFF